ncbi:MAG: alpha/beta fold hydrolase [Steroidobacteraceae bacterium]|jgi:pimeloyl-ACP methyl ester carboxylesterase/catechol 2,3-dioxygenase-like lactoylglutathione lyase family enzyme|nr:alpha/beta fold hydrolase [Steroidobacteraceae bacterium]
MSRPRAAVATGGRLRASRRPGGALASLLACAGLLLPAVQTAAAPAASAAPAADAPPAAATADPPGLVRRTTLVVHDLEASVRFYRDVLGFELWLENRGQVGPSSLPTAAPPGSPSRFAIMKGRHPWVGMVGLLQYGEPRPLPRPPAALRPGDAVLMLETTDLEGAWQRMQRAGTPILRPPASSEVTGAGGARWTARFLFAFDPDGHVLEINERLPAAPAPAAAGDAARAGPAAPVRVRREFVDGRYGQLHLRRASPTQAGGLHAPVVLLHQTPLSGRMFSELLRELGRDRVVYAPDTPGYGESDAPASPPELADYADALHDFVAGLKEPVDLVGYHTGAMIAAELAARHPGSVRRVVLVSMPLFAPERRAALVTTTPLAEDGSPLLAEWRSTMRVRPPGQTLEQAARIVAEKQRAGTRAGWALAALQRYDAPPRLQAISRPVTVVRPQDGLWDEGAAAARLIPGARLVDAPQWAFGLFDADPSGVARVIRDALD